MKVSIPGNCRPRTLYKQPSCPLQRHWHNMLEEYCIPGRIISFPEEYQAKNFQMTKIGVFFFFFLFNALRNAKSFDSK